MHSYNDLYFGIISVWQTMYITQIMYINICRYQADSNVTNATHIHTMALRHATFIGTYAAEQRCMGMVAQIPTSKNAPIHLNLYCWNLLYYIKSVIELKLFFYNFRWWHIKSIMTEYLTIRQKELWSIKSYREWSSYKCNSFT